MQRAQLVDVQETARTFTGLLEAVLEPGRLVRTAEEMSQMAPFIDGGHTVDRTNWPITVTSYYPLGGAIALALDLTLRDRSDGRLSLDDLVIASFTTGPSATTLPVSRPLMLNSTTMRRRASPLRARPTRSMQR